jgi:hypothetical protein
MKLTSQILKVADLSNEERTNMFAIYSEHYDATSLSQFIEDLVEKDTVILLRDRQSILRGFSTLMIWSSTTPQGTARVLFSGDTIISRGYWGTQALSFNWLRHAGKIKKEQPETRLFWLLIVKGHRTYRYLPTFSIEYYPDWRRRTPDWAQSLIHQFAFEKFGSAYRPNRGIVQFEQSRGQLIPALASLSAEEKKRPDVAFFLERNPGYDRGDELVCICELDTNNLKPIARRYFEAGMQ